jgi:hypothetical protein
MEQHLVCGRTRELVSYWLENIFSVLVTRLLPSAASAAISYSSHAVVATLQVASAGVRF